VVCVCFDLGLKTIVAAITEQQLADVGAIGKAIGAGTNCGSCRPALARVLADAGRTRETIHAAG
jgi:assimilatory nitrate reductase catalytic subunit